MDVKLPKSYSQLHLTDIAMVGIFIVSHAIPYSERETLHNHTHLRKFCISTLGLLYSENVWLFLFDVLHTAILGRK